MNARRALKVNDRGRRIGEDHWRARLTDHDVDLMLQLRAEGWGWRRLARAFECSRSHARRLCLGLRRAHTVAGHKAVPLPPR